jgi:Spy/CpxP family protein refolding chaperone
MKKMMVILAAAALVLGVAYAYAQGPGFGRGFGPGPENGPYGYCGDYGTSNPLTQDQRTQLRELRQKFFDETAPLRDSMRTKSQELRALWSDPKADPQAIMAKEKELGALQDQMRDMAVQQKIEARKILTPEQLSQLSQGGWGSGQGYRGGEGRMYGRGRGFGGGPCY